MEKLIQGIIDFRNKLSEEERELFARLSLGQKPDALFIACSDSRVVPNLFASTHPGELFVVRNVGNLVPPYGAHLQDSSAAAALEFANLTLAVSNIIVCGHSECGAIQALAQGSCSSDPPSALANWLQHARPSLTRLKKEFTPNPQLSPHNQLSQINVLQQVEHLTTYPFVQSRLEKGELHIHGWWFDIAHATVYYYNSQANQFMIIDETHAKDLLEEIRGKR